LRHHDVGEALVAGTASSLRVEQLKKLALVIRKGLDGGQLPGAFQDKLVALATLLDNAWSRSSGARSQDRTALWPRDCCRISGSTLATRSSVAKVGRPDLRQVASGWPLPLMPCTNEVRTAPAVTAPASPSSLRGQPRLPGPRERRASQGAAHLNPVCSFPGLRAGPITAPGSRAPNSFH
jgi:hypothetical protein